MLYKDRDKLRNDESTIQGTGRIASNHQELEETEGFFRLQREHGHTSALISNLLLPDCERIQSVVLSSQLFSTFYSISRKLTQKGCQSKNI